MASNDYKDLRGGERPPEQTRQVVHTAVQTDTPAKRPQRPGAYDFSSAATPSDSDRDLGLFGEDSGTRQVNRHVRRRSGIRLGQLPWLDMIMITLTAIGIIWVAMHFDAVTYALCVGIGSLLQSVLGVVMVLIAIAAGLFLLLRPRRPRYYY